MMKTHTGISKIIDRFQPLILFCLFSIFIQSTLLAENQQEPPEQVEPVKVNIKLAPNYKKTNLKDSKIQDNYKRAIHHNIPSDTPPEQYREIAKPLCLKHNPIKRKKYFVTLFTDQRTNALATFMCEEFDDSIPLNNKDESAKSVSEIEKHND